MSILLDFPKRPKTGAPNLLDLLPVVLGLRETLARESEVTIRVADLTEANLYGATTFSDNTVYLAHELDDEQWRADGGAGDPADAT